MALKIKKEFSEVVIGFNNNSTTKLGERKDLDKLFEIAKAANRVDYLNMFEQQEGNDKTK